MGKKIYIENNGTIEVSEDSITINGRRVTEEEKKIMKLGMN